MLKILISALILLCVRSVYASDHERFHDIDHRTLDLTNADHKKIVDAQVSVWIEDAKTKQQDEQILDIYRENENYYEGDQVPIGTTSNALREFVIQNFDTGVLESGVQRVKRNKRNLIYFVNNKLGQIIDRLTGDLTTAEKVITVEQDDDPHNDNIEKITRNYLDAHFYRKKFWTNTGRMLIKEMLKLGLYWVDVDYDPEVNVPLGDIQYVKYHPKDVLVDPLSVEEYFLDARFVIPKIRMEYHAALKFLEQFDVNPQNVYPDDDDSDYMYYNQNSRNRTESIGDDKFVTIYLPQYKLEYRSAYDAGKYSQTNAGAILMQKEMCFFKMVYTRGLGVVSHKKNIYVNNTLLDGYQFSIIPFYDKKNSTRLYPGSVLEKLKNTQDIINIIDSLILNTARDAAKTKVIVASTIKAKHPSLWQNFVDYGGQYTIEQADLAAVGGDINKLIKELKTEPIDPTIYQFLQIAEDSLKSQSIQHEALEGNYPKDNLSGVAIQRLQERNNITLTNKPQNIEWAFTQIGQLVYNIIATEYTAEHWMKITNNSLKAPINKVMTMKEYEQFLLNTYPETPIEESIDEFEKENLVEIIFTPRSVQDGRRLSKEEIKTEGGAVFINFLKAPDKDIYNLGVRVRLELDSERNKLEEKVIASQLLQQGKFPLGIFLEMQGGTFLAQKDRILKDLEDENKIMAVAKEIASHGDQFVNDFIKFSQKYEEIKKIQEDKQKDKVNKIQENQPQLVA